MSHWENAAITDAGVDMLNDLLAGRRLTVTNAYGGTEAAKDPAGLQAQTDVLGERTLLSLLDVEDVEDGKTVKIQISNTGVEEDFTLHQIGVFARLDEKPEQLLAVFQDERGVEVPSQASSPSFLLEFYGFLAITNGVKISVDLSGSGAVVTPQYLAGVMERHNASEYAHPDIRAELSEVRRTAEDAAEAKPEAGTQPPGPETAASPGQHYFDSEAKKEYICVGQSPQGSYLWVLVGEGALAAHNEDPGAHPDLRDACGGLDSRLSLLELMFTTDVTGNPFTVTFDTLTGLAVTGIWNTAQKCLEF